jgi:antitoxin component of MazEF toxin-antitoxin module
MQLMEWRNNVRKQGGSLAVTLPADYCKAKRIRKDQIAVFILNADGSLTIRIRDPVPVVNMEDGQ